MSNYSLKVASTEYHTVKSKPSHLKVEVKGRHHICIVRKALHGQELTIRVSVYWGYSIFLKTWAHDQVLKMLVIKYKPPKIPSPFSLWDNNQLHNSYHRSPSLTGNCKNRTGMRKPHFMRQRTMRLHVLKLGTHVALLKPTYSVPAMLFKNSITYNNIIFTDGSVGTPNQ